MVTISNNHVHTANDLVARTHIGDLLINVLISQKLVGPLWCLCHDLMITLTVGMTTVVTVVFLLQAKCANGDSICF